ncbi:exosome complex exonuclease DIS3/RRP44 [Nematocida displodere]|uniref:Exosome complex exonuclease DIS3/RRP44 n=1 Tax=Nematocida displodere TaxID=1805483 RepID=A0A177EDF1_9MICR|nr:exosome complex exonuclease DIS3/RRP44 [Nematocida displodere]
MSKVSSVSYRLHRSGRIQRVPSEVYLQDSVNCGFVCCGQENSQVKRCLRASFSEFLLPTEEFLYEYMPFIEEGVFPNLIVPRTSLAMLRLKYPSLQRRVTRVIERKNIFVLEDRNAKEIVGSEEGFGKEEASSPLERAAKACRWYKSHLPEYTFTAVTGKEDSLVEAYLQLPKIEIKAEKDQFPYLERTELQEKIATGELEQESIAIHDASGGAGRIYCGIEGFQTNIDIPEHALNRAINGDIVVVRVVSESEGTGTGVVVGIERRSRAPHACTVLEVLDSEHLLLKPVSQKIPVILARARDPNALKGQLLVAAIYDWKSAEKYPTGHIIRVIGKEGLIATETAALLAEHSIIDQEFEEAALMELPSGAWTVTAEDLLQREDLRDVPIASIDPEGCIDIDDALHARVLGSGLVEVGVHIADVTHFVKEESALDREGRIRGCTVYLPNRRIDMLPPLLGTNLCSLHKNQDRLTFSVIWEVEITENNDNGPAIKIKNTRFAKSVIRSRESFTYDHAAQVLAGLPYSDPEIVAALRLLKKVSLALTRERLANGAFVIHSDERRVTAAGSTTLAELSLSPEKHIVTEEHHPPQYDTHTLVEELMLLANHCVAEKTAAIFPKETLIRIHPSPSNIAFKELEAALNALSPAKPVTLDARNPSELSKILETASSSPDLKSTINAWASKCMTQAVYIPSFQGKKLHYGLAMENYTHFTSPIRRYADIVVHRGLQSALLEEPTAAVTQVTLEDICNSINRSNRNSKIIARETGVLYARHLMPSTPIALCVTSITPEKVSVYAPEFAIEGTLIHPDPSSLSLLSTVQGTLDQTKTRQMVFVCSG